MAELIGNIIGYSIVGAILLFSAYVLIIFLPYNIYRAVRELIHWINMTPKERERYRENKRRGKKRDSSDNSSDSGSGWWFSSDSAKGSDGIDTGDSGDGGGGGGGD